MGQKGLGHRYKAKGKMWHRRGVSLTLLYFMCVRVQGQPGEKGPLTLAVSNTSSGC